MQESQSQNLMHSVSGGVSFENDINKNYVFELIVDNVEMDSMLQQVGFTKVGAVGHDFYYSKQIRKVGGL